MDRSHEALRRRIDRLRAELQVALDSRRAVIRHQLAAGMSQKDAAALWGISTQALRFTIGLDGGTQR